MTEKDGELVNEWFGLYPNFSLEAKIMLGFSLIFENYLQDTSATKDVLSYVGDIRTKINISDLFND